MITYVTVACPGCGRPFEVPAEFCYDGITGEQWVEPQTDEDGDVLCECGDSIISQGD